MKASLSAIVLSTAVVVGNGALVVVHAQQSSTPPFPNIIPQCWFDHCRGSGPTYIDCLECLMDNCGLDYDDPEEYWRIAIRWCEWSVTQP